MSSPSGTLPAVRTRLRCAPVPPTGHSVVATPTVPEPTETDPETRLADEVAQAEADQAPWQDLVGPFIDEVNASARQWSSTAIAGFRADHAHLLSRYVSAMPLHNARILLTAMRAGRLEVRAGVPQRLTHDDAGWYATWTNSCETYDAAVNATGFLPPALPTFEAGTEHGALLLDSEVGSDRVVGLDADLRVRVGDPGLGDIQLPVDQSPVFPCCVGQKHPQLAVLHPPGGPGVLALHSGRFGTLLEKPGLIDDQHTVGLTEMPGDIGPHVIAQTLHIPRGGIEQTLHPIRSHITASLGQRPAVLVGQRRQQPPHRSAPARRRGSTRKNRSATRPSRSSRPARHAARPSPITTRSTPLQHEDHEVLLDYWPRRTVHARMRQR